MGTTIYEPPVWPYTTSVVDFGHLVRFGHGWNLRYA
jgi:hypothetical protein